MFATLNGILNKTYTFLKAKLRVVLLVKYIYIYICTMQWRRVVFLLGGAENLDIKKNQLT